MSVKHRTYFDGSVQSLELSTREGRATVGVIEPGRFRFDSDEEERIRVVAGAIRVRLVGSRDWREYRPGDVCVIPPNAHFDIEADEHAAYLCHYLGR